MLIARQRKQPLSWALNRGGALIVVAILLPFLPILALPELESRQTVLVLCLIGIVAALTYTIVSTFEFSLPVQQQNETLRGVSSAKTKLFANHLSLGLAVVLSISYALFFSMYTVAKHNAFQTHAFDLGIFDQVFWRIVHHGDMRSTLYGPQAVNHLGAHFSPIFFLLAPLYALDQDPRTLLVLQSIFLALGAMPAYLLARQKTGHQGLALTFSASYILYPALHGVNTFDFHEIALATPLLLFALYFLEKRRDRLFLLSLALALLSKEEVSLSGVAIGLYLILGQRRTRLGLGVASVSLIYFLVVTGWLMPTLGRGVLFDRFADMTAPGFSGFAGVIVTLLTNPVFTFKFALFNPQKLIFLAQLLLPVLFLPLLARRSWIMALPAFATALLATTEAQFQISAQYSAIMIPFVFFLAIAGLQRWQAASSRSLNGIAVAVLVSGLLMNYEFGAFASKQFRGLPRTDGHTAAINRLLAEIPASASVSTLSDIVPHASMRNNIYMLPVVQDADYLFFDLNANANTWPFPKQENASQFVMGYMVSGGYGLVKSEEGCLLFKRDADLTQNEAAIQTLLTNSYQASTLPSDFSPLNLDDPQAMHGIARVGRPDLAHAAGKDALTFGPYASLLPGKYRVEFRLKFVGDRNHDTVARLDAIADSGARQMARRDVLATDFTTPGQYQTFTLDFESDKALSNAEYRVQYLGRGELWVDDIQVSPVEVQIPINRIEAESLPSNFNVLNLPDAQASQSTTRVGTPTLAHEGGAALIYGPHATLMRGQYRVEFALKLDQTSIQDQVAILDVSADAGAQRLTTLAISGANFATANQYQKFPLEFTTDKPLADVEYRVFYPGRGTLSIDYVDVTYQFKRANGS